MTHDISRQQKHAPGVATSDRWRHHAHEYSTDCTENTATTPRTALQTNANGPGVPLPARLASARSLAREAVVRSHNAVSVPPRCETSWMIIRSAASDACSGTRRRRDEQSQGAPVATLPRSAQAHLKWCVVTGVDVATRRYCSCSGWFCGPDPLYFTSLSVSGSIRCVECFAACGGCAGNPSC